MQTPNTVNALPAATRCRILADCWQLGLTCCRDSDEEWGQYDSNGGLDFHIPVVGSGASTALLLVLGTIVATVCFPQLTRFRTLRSSAVVKEPPLHVVHIAVEMAPICKVSLAIHQRLRTP